MKTVPLAADHKGMKVCYQGLIAQSRKAMKREHPILAEMLRQLELHLTELGQRWYTGDQTVVDEFLQLYCIDSEGREAVKLAADESQANARLIAAAPEMLEALLRIEALYCNLRHGGPAPEDLQSLSDALEEACNTASDAIALATNGEQT